MSNQNKPLVSTEDDMPDKHSGGGCFGRIAECVGSIIIICLIISGIRSCGKSNETKSTNETPHVASVETTSESGRFDATIILEYKEVPLTANAPMYVYVDDENLGQQEAGTSKVYTIVLEEGSHQFYLESDGHYRTKKIKFDVLSQGETFTFSAENRLDVGVEVSLRNILENTLSTDSVTSSDVRSPEALSLENLLFHRPYTDLGYVRIHNFPERGEALEWLATYCTDKELFSSGHSVSLADPLFGQDYYYCTVSETNLYYIGEIKNNRPDGFGAVVGLATGSGTYDFKGEALFYCAGNFKEGMLDGYGISFAADEADITHAVQDVLQIMGNGDMSDDLGEKLLRYLFDYVSYEGYWKEGKKDGKGNTFGFSWYDDEIRFIDELNPPLEGYVFGPVYPNVTMGEYDDGKLNGEVNIYKYNHLVYSGEMKDGQRSGYGISYYNNGQAEYDGEWRRDAANGMGTYYDQDGVLIYTGKWKNGDYEH